MSRTLPGSSKSRSSRTHAGREKRAAEARHQARRLLLEGLEVRNLMAFNLLAEHLTDSSPTDLALTQINAGAQLDLAIAKSNNTGSLDVRLGGVGGAFGPAQTSDGGAYLRSIATGDFDGGGTDMVTAGFASVSFLHGNGDGTFQAAVNIALDPQSPPNNPDPFTPLAQTPRSVATGDLNGDGNLDLVVASDIYFSVFNGCGWYGCYYSNYNDGYVNVLLGNGMGGFGPAEVHHLGTFRSPNAVAVGDVNGDTLPDVITANGWDLSVLLGDGLGSVANPIHSGSGSPFTSISLGDVDGDGKVDTVMRSGWGLSVQKGNGLGSFTAQPTLNLPHSADSAVIGDVNADGKLDLVAAGGISTFTCTNQGWYYCYEGHYDHTRQASVLIGKGSAGFTAPVTSSLGDAPGYNWLPDLALSDVTGDSKPDLVVLDYYASSVIVAASDGDFRPPPSIVIQDAVAVTEGNTVNAEFTVMLEGEHGNVSVQYATEGNTAADGIDYTTTVGTLSFTSTEFSKTISVPIKGDSLDEIDEQFFVNIFSPFNGVIADSRASGKILDDDPTPSLSINDVSLPEGQQHGTKTFSFIVTLSAPSGNWVSVNYATANGTATTSDNDYNVASSSVSIAPGQTTATIFVTVRGDKKKEADETFFVNLSGASNATIADNQGVGTIKNDDGNGNGNGNGRP